MSNERKLVGIPYELEPGCTYLIEVKSWGFPPEQLNPMSKGATDV